MRETPISSSQAGSVQPTRAALLTPPGRGALAVVGVTGPGAAEAVDRLFVCRGTMPPGSRPDGAIAFGTWRSSGEDVVIVRHAADRLEVHGHGGTAAPAAVLAGLLAAGAASGRWQDWVAGGPCRREAFEALPAAVAPRAAMILSRQAAGLMDDAIERLGGMIVRGEHHAARSMAGRLLGASRVGLRLTEPWRVVLAGPVNAGKSSLLNAILGHGRSIVSPLPGTTRDLLVTTAVLGGWAVDLIDTAGTRVCGDVVSAAEREGIVRAEAAMRTADLVVRVLPADAIADPVSRAVGSDLVVISKADLPIPSLPPGDVVTSAVTGVGIERLAGAIVERLVPEEAADPALLAGAVPFTRRQVETIERMVGGPT